MANTYRRPVLEVSLDGQLAPRVISARVSKGLNQNYTTAELTFPWRYPEQLKQWGGVTVLGGGSASGRAVHFSGHALDPSMNLWTPRVTMRCGSALARCERWYPPFSNTMNGLTDIEAIEFILNDVGITDRTIAGHGKFIGHLATSAMTWTPQISALEMIQQIDTQVGLGYRTFDTGTTVVRQFIPLQPNEMTPVYTFNEGVDIISATATRSPIEPAGRVIINGDGVSSDVSTDSYGGFQTPFTVRWLMIQREAVDAGYVSAAEVAAYILARMTRNLVTVSLVTHIDRPFSPGQVVKVVSEKLALSQVFYIQQDVASWEGATFRRQLELVSELDTRETPGGDTPIGVVDPIDMTPIDILPLPPIDFPIITPVIDVTAAITIVAIDKEKIIVAGAEIDAWIVYAVDSSTVNQGTIASRAWTASGPVLAGWETGTGLEFVTVFTSLSGAVISILVTASGSETGTASRDVGLSPGVVTKTLELFLAAGVNAEAWAPGENDWNVDPQSAAADVEDVANGPFWSLPVATNSGMYSTDYLATGASEVTIPFTDGSVAGVRSWIEPDVDEQLVGVIGTNGEVAFSQDRGATWSVKAGPGGAGRDIIISRFVPGQVHVLTATGYHVSDDYGNTWRTIVLGTTFKWLTLSHSRNVIVTNAGGIVTADENLTAFSGPSGVVTVAAHIREDRFVALTSAGNVWRTTTDGGTVMEDLGAISGTPVHSYRHGSIPDFYAYAAGTSGAYKLIIRTNAGPTYEVKTLQIRAPSIGNSAAASNYSRIGVGRMVDIAPVAAPGALLVHTEDEGVFMRSAAGTWFRPTTTEGNTPTDIKRGRIFSVAVARDNASRMFAYALENTGFPNGRLYTSSDGGVNWTELTGPAADVFHNVVCPADGTVYVAGVGGIWKSTDNGANWSQIATLTPGTVESIQVGTNRIWYRQDGGGADLIGYCGLDGSSPTTVSGSTGIAWDVISAPSDDLCVAANIGAGTTGARVHKITTSGVTDITPAGLGTATVWECHAVSATVFLLMSYTGTGAAQVTRIWRTDDAGASWTNVFTYSAGEGPTRAGSPSYHHFASPFGAVGGTAVVWANGHASSTYQHRVYRSTDGGATWSAAILNDAEPDDGGGGWLVFGPGGLAV